LLKIKDLLKNKLTACNPEIRFVGDFPLASVAWDQLIFEQSQRSFVKDNIVAHYTIIILIGLIGTAPAILYGFPDVADDTVNHILWYTNFSRQLWSGELYPRWLLGMNGGLGSPSLFFYGPVSYYATSVFHPFFGDEAQGWKQLGSSAGVALVFSGLFAYGWLKTMAGKKAALVGAISYMIIPYHLAVDLYDRGAFAEYWGLTWAPLVLYFTMKVTAEGKLGYSVIGLMLIYSLLIMTHLPTTLIFSLIPPAYAFFMAEKDQKMASLFRVAVGMTLGIGLAAVYLFPAMLLQKYISIETMRKDYFYWENWFLFSELNPLKTYTGKLTIITSTIIAVAVAAFLLSRSHKNSRVRSLSVFWIGVASFSVFMTTPLSKLIYKLIPILQAIQFPYRFNTALTIAAAAVITLGVSSIKRPFTPYTFVVVPCASLLFIAWIGVTCFTMWQGYSSHRDAAEIMQTRQEIMGLGLETSEYHPRWMQSSFNKEMLHELLGKIGEDNQHVVQARIPDESAQISVKQWEPREISMNIELKKDAVLTVSQFYFPGWTVKSSPDATPSPSVIPSTPDGLLAIPLTAGQHQISLQLKKSAPERIGQMVSLGSALTALSLSMAFFFRKKSQTDLLKAQPA
jgi:hypothetical protein